MKNIITFYLIILVFTGQACAEEYKSPIQVAEEKLAEFFPALEALSAEYPNDVEIQMGLAFLYTVPIPGLRPKHRFFEAQAEKILAIDPNNRPIWAMKAKRISYGYTAEWNSLLDNLQGQIKIAKGRGVKEIKIFPYEELHQWFGGKGQKTVVIKDFELAVKQLKEKLTQKLPPVLDALNEGESIDPDNALYNYLKAHIYFERNEKGKAIKEIEKAVAKKYFNTYMVELGKARTRVYEEVNFPHEHRKEFGYPVLTEPVGGKELRELAETYESLEDFKNAEKIDRLIIGMAKQIREEPLPYNSEWMQRFSLHLENQANQHIQQLHEKMATQLQQPALEQPVVEEPVIDIEQLIKWIEDLWLDGELKEIMTEEEYLEFRKSIEESSG